MNLTQPSMHRHSGRRTAIVLAVLGVGLTAAIATNVAIGSTDYPPIQIIHILAAGPSPDAASQIIWEIRLPRAIASTLLGGSLALSGLLLQVFFDNPIADPFVLGISSGAKLCVALLMIVVMGAGSVMTTWMSVAAAVTGSLLAMVLVLAVSRRVRSRGTLIVAGVMIGYICSAATNFLIAFADDQSIVNLHNWSLGSFSGTSWTDIVAIAPTVAITAVATFVLSKPLGAYQLGEDYAHSVGVNIRVFRSAIVMLSSIMSACTVAFAGPISFVGIAAPHLAKQALGTSKPVAVVPASFLMGALLCSVCDLIARMLFSPVELSVSAVTAVLGAPLVIWLMIKKRGL